MSDLWYDAKTKEVLIYEGYILHRGPLFIFKRLLAPDNKTSMRESERNHLRRINEMEALALVSK